MFVLKSSKKDTKFPALKTVKNTELCNSKTQLKTLQRFWTNRFLSVLLSEKRHSQHEIAIECCQQPSWVLIQLDSQLRMRMGNWPNSDVCKFELMFVWVINCF